MFMFMLNVKKWDLSLWISGTWAQLERLMETEAPVWPETNPDSGWSPCRPRSPETRKEQNCPVCPCPRSVPVPCTEFFFFKKGPEKKHLWRFSFGEKPVLNHFFHLSDGPFPMTELVPNLDQFHTSTADHLSKKVTSLERRTGND